MNVYPSAKLAPDHVAEIAAIHVTLRRVPGEGAGSRRVSFTVPVSEPGRLVARFWFGVPDGGFAVFCALIIARAKRNAREQQQRAENKKESSTHG